MAYGRRVYNFQSFRATGPTEGDKRFGGTEGEKNYILNKMLEGGGLNALDSTLDPRGWKDKARSLLSPEEFASYSKGIMLPRATPAAAPAAAPATPAPAPGGSGTPGGTIDANSLMELYQKGLGAGEAKGPSTDDQIKLLREGNQLDLQRKRAEQDMQMEGQRTALSQTQEARAKERETEANLQRRQQSTERSNAMAAFKGL